MGKSFLERTEATFWTSQGEGGEKLEGQDPRETVGFLHLLEGLCSASTKSGGPSAVVGVGHEKDAAAEGRERALTTLPAGQRLPLPPQVATCTGREQKPVCPPFREF